MMKIKDTGQDKLHLKPTLVLSVNQDVMCPGCDQPGAVKTEDMNEYGYCFKCVERRMGMIIGHKTISIVVQEISQWLQRETSEIDTAYQEAGNDLNVSISVKFNTDKYGKHKYKVKGKFPTGHITFERDGDIDEDQQQLPGMD